MKKKILCVLFLAVAAVAIGVGASVLFSQDDTIDFAQLCPQESSVQFIKANICRRQGEQGQVKDLFEVTSEDRADLLGELPSVLKQYRYKSDSQASAANDFISLSFAYSDSVVYRFDVYSDSTLVMVASKDAGIWKVQSSSVGQEGLYWELYNILIAI